MTYGSEAWYLTTQVQKKINGAHSRMMSIITGKTPREETTRGTQTMDLLMRIRARRLQWLGQILRMQDDRMIKNAVKYMYENPREGDLMMDAPKTSCWDELCKMAHHKITWNTRVKSMHSPRLSISTGPHLVPAIDYAFTTS